MAQHEVKFTVPERPLGKADVEFAISAMARRWAA